MAKEPAYYTVVVAFSTAITGEDLLYRAGDVISADHPVFVQLSKDVPEWFKPWAPDHAPAPAPEPAGKA